MTDNGVSVYLLADHPHLVPAVGEMRWKEWGNEPGREDLRWWVDVTAREAGRDALPVTWVAIDDRGRAVGAVVSTSSTWRNAAIVRLGWSA